MAAVRQTETLLDDGRTQDRDIRRQVRPEPKHQVEKWLYDIQGLWKVRDQVLSASQHHGATGPKTDTLQLLATGS